MEYRINPRKVSFCVGSCTDFSGWVTNPYFKQANTSYALLRFYDEFLGNYKGSVIHGIWISINSKDRLIWNGSYKELQMFVEEVLDMSDGVWDCPGGEAGLPDFMNN